MTIFFVINVITADLYHLYNGTFIWNIILLLTKIEFIKEIVLLKKIDFIFWNKL